MSLKGLIDYLRTKLPQGAESFTFELSIDTLSEAVCFSAGCKHWDENRAAKHIADTLKISFVQLENRNFRFYRYASPTLSNHQRV